MAATRVRLAKERTLRRVRLPAAAVAVVLVVAAAARACCVSGSVSVCTTSSCTMVGLREEVAFAAVAATARSRRPSSSAYEKAA